MRKWLRSMVRWIKTLFAKITMRRKISLYIADQLVDLDDQSFILFNYQMDDLSNPTIVKNSFSQQITLKGTPANNKIFGWSFRLDRKVGNGGGQSGADYNASRKTPFAIYNELGEILESGYVKLDSVSRNGEDVQYKVTLYGGLGSFFYALSYDDNGNKRTLADLDYLGTGSPESELTFAINAAAVQAAWDRLEGDTSAPEMWDVINFAPAYNGIPEGNFSPDKALVVPSDVGLQDTITKDGVSYDIKSGYSLVNLAEAQDEWSVKDLRSYLQRPVFSMRALWDAICNPANNGGYEVDASVLQSSLAFGDYTNLWMTLPLMPSIGTLQQMSGDLSVTMSSTASSGNEIGRYDISGSVPSGTKVTANLHCRVRFNMPSGADAYDSLLPMVSANQGRTTFSKLSAIFIQAVAYGSDDTIVGGSRIKVYGNNRNLANIASACGYVPAWLADYERLEIAQFEKVSAGVYQMPSDLEFTIDAQDVAYYKILVSVYPGTRISDGSTDSTTFTGDGDISTPVMYEDYETGFTSLSTFIIQGSVQDTITYTSSESLRSGAVITKRMLLSSSHTPAEYMISFCKIFGLYFDYDPATRKVTILRRDDLYQDETIDLTKRVDLSKGVSVKPMVFDAKWYDFNLEGVGGAFYEEYQNLEGIPYGIQRVNTGFDFNADSVNLMESVVFKTACSVLAKSKYFNAIFKGQDFQPSPFLDKGNTYTLWAATGETLETDISCPPDSASVTYYNLVYPGYDKTSSPKMEFMAKDGKPIDGSDVLLFVQAWDDYDYFKLTDDVPAMDTLNEGVPCWLLAAGDSLRIPSFARYKLDNHYEWVNSSLDFGTPRQVDIPGIKFIEGGSLYARAWQSYMADRYDVNTKVMTCRVDFSGLQVNHGLLRRFYWFDNSLWVLNKIKNYSLTTYDPVECEFIQVQDKDNYLNGQSY